MTNMYLDHDATGLAALVAKGDVSADELLDCALERAVALNPAINAVVHMREQTARDAINAGLPDGPFKGVPFLMKDLGCEARDYPTSNGSKLFANTTWSYDSDIFLRMQETGLVPFGRTTSPELGVGPVTESHAYGGPTRNPWHLGHTSGGSSGGSGAAVAAGIVPAAHGSDGGGSVRIPASSSGLVGYKPTRARLPNGPGSGEGWGGMALDGFLTRSLRDTVTLLDACDGPGFGAPYHPPQMDGSFADAAARDPARLKIRFCTTTLGGERVHAECATAVRNTAKLLADLGHDVDEWVVDPTLDVEGMMRAWTRIVACGTALTVHGKLAGAPVDPTQIEGVTQAAIRLADTISGADYLAAVNEIHAFGYRMEGVFLDCDVLVTPTLAEPPCEIGRLKPDHDDFMAYRVGPGSVFEYSPYTAVFNASGQPAVSLPLHWSADMLPVGVHLAMAFGDDARLMSLSAQIERAAPWHATQQRLLNAGGIWPRD